MVRSIRDARSRFEEYLRQLAGVVGHKDREEPLRAYLMGLCLPGDRKSVEPMAARIDPRHVRARHQSLHHFVSNAPWNEKLVLFDLCIINRHHECKKGGSVNGGQSR